MSAGCAGLLALADGAGEGEMNLDDFTRKASDTNHTMQS